MHRNEMTWPDMIAEAVGLVSAFLYLGLQIYYGILYGAKLTNLVMNVAAMLLVYAGLTMLAVYPERVNGLTEEACTGKIRRLTIQMVRLIKLIFVFGLLFTSVCDVMGKEMNEGYSLVVVTLILMTAGIFEYRIIRLLRAGNKK